MRKRELEHTVHTQAGAIALLYDMVKGLQLVNASMVAEIEEARLLKSTVLPPDGLNETIITGGRIYALERLGHTFNSVFFEQLRDGVEDPRSLVLPAPDAGSYTMGQMIYAATYLSLIATKAIEEASMDVDGARELMNWALDHTDDYIVTVEDLEGGVLAIGEDFYGDDDAEEPEIST